MHRRENSCCVPSQQTPQQSTTVLYTVRHRAGKHSLPMQYLINTSHWHESLQIWDFGLPNFGTKKFMVSWHMIRVGNYDDNLWIPMISTYIYTYIHISYIFIYWNHQKAGQTISNHHPAAFIEDHDIQLTTENHFSHLSHLAVSSHEWEQVGLFYWSIDIYIYIYTYYTVYIIYEK